MAIDALHFLLDLQKFARKSFEWWDDAALMEMPLVYMPTPGKTKICIKFPTEKVSAWDIAQFLGRCRKAWGNDAPILSAVIFTDAKRRAFLVWDEKASLWRDCERLLDKWAQAKQPTARVIQLAAAGT